MRLTELQKRSVRREPVYQTIVQDLMQIGALDPKIGMALITVGPRGIQLPVGDPTVKPPIPKVEVEVAPAPAPKKPKATVPYKKEETIKA